MNSQEFMEEVENSYKRSVEVLLEKEKEYAEEGDRLAQFRRIAERRKVHPYEALIDMAAKHYDSIELMVKHPYNYSIKEWDEKITDLRNYTFLLDALLRDMGIK